MRRTLQLGDVAPDFDLASTEDAMIMLRDEIPRTPVLLYFFSGPEAGSVRSDLTALKGALSALSRVGVKVLAVSSTKLDELKALQLELGLPFPLLHDDRNLSAPYGLETGEEAAPTGVAVLVGRDQKVVWLEDPAPAMGEGAQAAIAALSRESSTVNYPRKVINRLVDRWVN